AFWSPGLGSPPCCASAGVTPETMRAATKSAEPARNTRPVIRNMSLHTRCVRCCAQEINTGIGAPLQWDDAGSCQQDGLLGMTEVGVFVQHDGAAFLRRRMCLAASMGTGM